MIDRWATVVAERARTVVVSVLLIAGAAAYGVGGFGSLSQGGFDTPGSESNTPLEIGRETFGNRSADVVAIYSAQVRPYYAAPPGAGLVTADGRMAQVVMALQGGTPDDFPESYDAVEPLLPADGLETDIAGPCAVYSDVNHQTEGDLQQAELISLPLVILLGLVIFGSAVAASMAAMVGGLGVVRLLTTVTDVSVFSVNVVSVLGIGLAIGHALFVVSRLREELARLPEDDPTAPRVAIRTTLATAGRTVLFSGLTVAASPRACCSSRRCSSSRWGTAAWPRS